MRSAIVRLGCIALAPCILGACAPLTEQDIYDWHERRNMAFEESQIWAEKCTGRGAHMSMRARPLEKPGPLDRSTATCVRR
jgi:hypothetical protein